MAKVVIYSTEVCPYCTWAKQLLDAKKIPYEEILIDLQPDQRAIMEKLSGRRTVPQIFINGQPIGGYDDLSGLAKSGKLDELLK